jgi:hypothetical protein
MNWTDTVKATGLAALAGRTASADQIFDAAPSGWTRHDAWLTRVKPSRTRVTQPSTLGSSISLHQSTALRD